VLWGWWIDGLAPDVFDVLGAIVCLLGVGLIMYAPR
jgi:small multidrug resistance family-3 protein